MNAVNRRLLKELQDYQKEVHPDLIDLSPIKEDNLLVWKAVLRGENDTPYQGICMHVKIHIHYITYLYIYI